MKRNVIFLGLILILSFYLVSCGMESNQSLSDNVEDFANDYIKETSDIVLIETNNKQSTSNSTYVSENEISYESNANHMIDETNRFSYDSDLSYEKKQELRYQEEIDKITDKPYDSIIKQTVSDDILTDYWGFVRDPRDSWTITPVTMDDQYGTEIMRELDQMKMYTIHKPESGGLFYCYYMNSILVCTAYMSKNLSKQDFNNISIGDPIAKVEQIEPLTQLWQDQMDEWDDTLSQNSEHSAARDDTFEESKFTQELVLKDSLLLIQYQKIDGTYLIKNMEYHDDFKRLLHWEGFDSPSEIEYDYAILPEDYPIS